MSTVFLITSVVWENVLLSTNVVVTSLVFMCPSLAASALKNSNQVGLYGKRKSRLLQGGFSIYRVGGALFALAFGSIVENLECAGVTQFLLNVANEAHLGVLVGLDGEGDEGTVSFYTTL